MKNTTINDIENVENVDDAIESIEMLDTKRIIMDIAADKGIKVNGLEKIPIIIKGCPAVSFHKNDEEILRNIGIEPDDLFEGQGYYNTAIFPATKNHGIRVEPLRIVSNQYKLIQHDKMVLEVINAIPKEIGVHSINISCSHDGAKCYANFKTNKSSEIVPGDIIEFRIGASNSVDGSKMFNLWHGAWRQWCSNGAMAPDSRFKKTKSRKLHKSTLELNTEIEKFVASLDQAQEVIDGWKKYAKTPLTIPDVDELFIQLETGPRVQEELLNTELKGDNATPKNLLENKNLTAWNMFNAFTQRITHSDSEEAIKIENGKRVSEIFERFVNA